jgi:hypothetical protein
MRLRYVINYNKRSNKKALRTCVLKARLLTYQSTVLVYCQILPIAAGVVANPIAQQTGFLRTE